MSDYVAYHSSDLMGFEYWPKERFHFFSRKAERFLQRAIGCRVWVVVSAYDGPRRVYRLAGMFKPSVIHPEDDGLCAPHQAIVRHSRRTRRI